MADTREPSPRSRRVFRGGKQEKDKKNNTKTKGQRLADSGEFLKDPETEVDTSKPLQIKKGTVDYSKTAKEEEFDKTIDPEGNFEKGIYKRPSVETLKEGARIRNRNNLTIQGLTGVAVTGAKILELMISPLLRQGVY